MRDVKAIQYIQLPLMMRAVRGYINVSAKSVKNRGRQRKEDEWKRGLLRETATEEDALKEYFCVPKKSSGGYIPRPLVDRATDVTKVIERFECDNKFITYSETERNAMTLEWLLSKVQPHLDNLNPNLRHSFGVDFARTGDLSVFAVCAGQADTARHFDADLGNSQLPIRPTKANYAVYFAEIASFYRCRF